MNVTPKPHLHQDWVDPHAVGIVRALQKKGYMTYLVGGCVRDLLIGIHPKDFDIATTAKPDEVKRTIHRAYVIGKRFRLVLVRRDEMQFEVATFRRELREDEVREEVPAGDNIFGTAEEYAQRRDFTINGLFYDPVNDQLIDYAEGLPDLDNRVVRMIGDPMKRLVEDPIRIMRALRLKHMIEFTLDDQLRRAMMETAHSLPTTALPRRREEILKWLRLKNPDLAFREAHDLGILKFITPTLDEALGDEEASEIFYSYLRQIPKFMEETLSPGELFGMLVLAYTRAYLQSEPGAGARDTLGSEKVQAWMRVELGMFKFEQALTGKALHVEPLLGKRREFQRKGERRQRALLSNDAFPLAMRFATEDYYLSCEDWLYWTESFARLKEQHPNLGNGGGSGGGAAKRRRRRPRRPRTGGGVKAGAEVRS
jgi:poly(A) polymerase